MIKIFRYELARILRGKIYWIAAAILMIYASEFIQRNTLVGLYYTAPYSPWSFLEYQGHIVPLLLVVILYYGVTIFAHKERQVSAVTSASPLPEHRRMWMKVLALAVGFIILSFSATLLVFGYYAVCLEFWNGLALIGIWLLVWIPNLCIHLGISLWLGRKQLILGYGWMALLIAAAFVDIRLPMAVDFLGTSILKLGEVGTLVNGAISFQPPVVYLISRTGFALLGFLLILLDCRQQAQKS